MVATHPNQIKQRVLSTGPADVGDFIQDFRIHYNALSPDAQILLLGKLRCMLTRWRNHRWGGGVKDEDDEDEDDKVEEPEEWSPQTYMVIRSISMIVTIESMNGPRPTPASWTQRHQQQGQGAAVVPPDEASRELAGFAIEIIAVRQRLDGETERKIRGVVTDICADLQSYIDRRPSVGLNDNHSPGDVAWVSR